MKHIGIAAVTVEGAALCYQTICRRSQEILGEHHHPEISLHSHSFHRILEAQRTEQWSRVADLVLESIVHLRDCGADFAIIPANSIHFAIDLIASRSPIPVWNILSLAAGECKKQGFKKVLTLGVGITMSRKLFFPPLAALGIEAVVPSITDQETMNSIIYKELVQGHLTDLSRSSLVDIALRSCKIGVDAVLLGCTELPLALSSQLLGVPVIDTTRLLALRAAEYATADFS